MPSIMPGLYHKEQKLYNRGCVSYLWIFFFFRVRSSNLGELESQINSLPPKGHEVGCWKGRNKHSGLVTNFLSFQPKAPDSRIDILLQRQKHKKDFLFCAIG